MFCATMICLIYETPKQMPRKASYYLYLHLYLYFLHANFVKLKFRNVFTEGGKEGKIIPVKTSFHFLL